MLNKRAMIVWRKDGLEFFNIFAHISTLSTFMPHGSVASSSIFWTRYRKFLKWSVKIPTCIAEEMLSLSLRISCKFFVPKIFRRVVWESNLKDVLDWFSHFFSNHQSLQLFLYFIINHQLSEKAIWKMLLINFSCFLIISAIINHQIHLIISSSIINRLGEQSEQARKLQATLPSPKLWLTDSLTYLLNWWLLIFQLSHQSSIITIIT